MCPVRAIRAIVRYPVLLEGGSDIGPAPCARNVSFGCFVSRVLEHQEIIIVRKI
jgi:hypothetical protein